MTNIRLYVWYQSLNIRLHRLYPKFTKLSPPNVDVDRQEWSRARRSAHSTLAVPKPVPGGPPTVHILDVSSDTPFSTLGTSTNKLMSWIRCFWLGSRPKFVLLGGLQEQSWEPLLYLTGSRSPVHPRCQLTHSNYIIYPTFNCPCLKWAK